MQPIEKLEGRYAGLYQWKRGLVKDGDLLFWSQRYHDSRSMKTMVMNLHGYPNMQPKPRNWIIV